jgi:exopolysaccharide biosynthesis polyprenyl glycosylphosphotransferase
MDEQPASDTRPPNDRLQRWQRVYARRVLVTDLLVILGSVATAQLIRFRLLGDQESVLVDGRWPEDVTVSYTVLSLVLTIVWMITLQVLETRDHRIIGAGFTEYKRILDSTVGTFGVFAMVALMLKISTARGYLFIAFPLGLLLLLVSRFLWRSWLNARRRDGRFQYRAVIVGELAKVLHVAREITREPNAGYQIVGAVTERLNGDDCEILGVVHQSPTLSPEAILAVLDELGADTLVLTSSDTLGPEKMRSLSWTLEERDVELVVAPALTDIAGPRIHTRPVAGLPLIHIEFPEFTGRRYWAKRAFDVIGSGLLILLLSPVLIAVALAVKLTSRGPLFFAHTRIGQHGEPFKMYKFRSMVPDADAQLAELLAEQGTSDQPLFKVQNDPRITPVGRFIRRYSLDELPPLFNAFLGSMSLVGPRPQVEAEVALYDNAAYRRLLVKPGLTGLWQVSGRSNLSWEDALRLDLYYVENWSLPGDIIILGRTFKAVLSPDGAV